MKLVARLDQRRLDGEPSKTDCAFAESSDTRISDSVTSIRMLTRAITRSNVLLHLGFVREAWEKPGAFP